MPKMNEMLFKLEFFQYARSLDLNTRYYHIRLTEDASNLCTIIIPWRKYRYKFFPMGVSNLMEHFQQKMSKSFQGFKFIHAYIDDLFVLTKGECTDHVHKLEFTLNQSK